MPVRDPDRFLVFGAPSIGEPEIEEVVATLRSGWLGTGPRVRRFEEAFASFSGVSPEHVVGVSSCSAALHLSLLAAGVGPGDEVITTPLTFCATANAILHAGAVPVLADIDPTTMNLDPDAVAALVGERTRAILPVHFAGRGCDMTRLNAIAERHSLVVIEDCAHAVGTRIDGKPAGTLGDFGCFSFYATKNITTGEGGLLIGRDAAQVRRARTLALHGLSHDAYRRFGARSYRHYDVVEPGFKYNMMDLQAALGIHQLQRLEESLSRRRAVWRQYDEALASLPLVRPAPPDVDDQQHAHHLYTVLIDEAEHGVSRDEFLERMTREGIGVGAHYPSLAEYAYYQQRLGWRPEQAPHAMRIGRQTASLPLTASLTDDDVRDVVAAVRASLGC